MEILRPERMIVRKQPNTNMKDYRTTRKQQIANKPPNTEHVELSDSKEKQKEISKPHKYLQNIRNIDNVTLIIYTSSINIHSASELFTTRL
jgi:hypothetical protein